MSKSILFIAVVTVMAACTDPVGPEALVIQDVVVTPIGPATDSVAVSVHALNLSGAPVRVSKCFGLDIEVRDASGDLVWRRVEGLYFLLCIDGYDEIAPYRVRDWSAAWGLVDRNGDPVPAGTYELTAVLRELAMPDPAAVRSRPVSVGVE